MKPPEMLTKQEIATVSVVVPCYNEEEVIGELYERLSAAAGTWGVEYEVVAIDDGSRDGTWDSLLSVCHSDQRWRAVRLSRNFGHQAAVSAGLRHARGDAVIIIDADLQDPPEVLGRFIASWQEGFEVVYGIRRQRKEGLIKRSLYSGFYRVLSLLSDSTIPRDSGDFSIIDRVVVDHLNALPERTRFVRGLRAWVGFRQTGLEYERSARAAGSEKYDVRRLIALAKVGIFSFSTVPLALLTRLGFTISAVTFGAAILYLVRRLVTATPVPGFATLVIAVLFLGGIQLIGLGLLGEYIGRIYDEVKQRPPWLVREIAGGERNWASRARIVEAEAEPPVDSGGGPAER